MRKPGGAEEKNEMQHFSKKRLNLINLKIEKKIKKQLYVQKPL